MTVRRIRKSPSRSATKDASIACSGTSTAALPAGLATNSQRYDSRSPSGSVDPAPVMRTVALTATVWSAPAFAFGGLLMVLTRTSDGALARPDVSVTTRRST